MREANLRTWFDEDRMRGDILAQMTNGIDRSNSVAVFVTPAYLRKAAGEGPRGFNDNCKVTRAGERTQAGWRLDT